MQWLQGLFDSYGCILVSVLFGVVGVIMLISFLDRHRSSDSQSDQDKKRNYWP